MTSPSQSTFVTVVAWIALLLSGFSVLASVPQIILIPIVMRPDEISAAELSQMPSSARFMFQNMIWIAVLNAVVWIVTLLFSYGLLKRREWGRVGFVAVLLVMALGIIAMALFQNQMIVEMFAGAGEIPPDAAQFFAVMRAMFILFPLVLLSLLGFLAYRLNSSAIRAEFS